MVLALATPAPQAATRPQPPLPLPRCSGSRLGLALRRLGLALALTFTPALVPAADAATPTPGTATATASPRWRSNRVLILPKAANHPRALEDFHRRNHHHVLRRFPRLGNLQVVEVPPGQSVESTLQSFRASALVDLAEPDYLLHTCLEPNDPAFANGTQWYLENHGQSGGRADADIDAAQGWDILHDAGSVIVAIVDSGIRYSHQDLADNVWVNLGEIPGNGIDDDRNGYIDDVHGINAINGRGDPSDDVGHGTHIAGLIGAVGNNGIGGAGVAWKVQLMGCKFIDTTGDGSTSDAIECLDYARAMGAQVINCSWGNSASSTALRTAFQRLRDAGIVVAVAAGNEGRNNDTSAMYPANYDFDNLVSVVATSATDTLADFSNYGLTTTDLGAPGVGIRSTWYTSDQAYSTQSGTSMSTPLVSGALALLRARYSTENPAQLIERLTASSDTLSALQNRCRSGGRLNLGRALSENTFANFTASTWQGSPPLAVQFTNTSRGSIASQRWDFGDGSSSTEPSPSHVFTSEGNYTVTLEVTATDATRSSKSQTIMVVGNYTIAPGTYEWIDPTPMATVPLGDNSVTSPLSLPFSFPFYGQTYDAIRIGANGILGFAPDGMGTTSNSSLPLQALPNGIICPYWDNLNPGAGGSVRRGTVGTAPNRSFVVSWVDVPMNQGGARLTFQAILEESSGRIRFQYLQVQPTNNRGAGRRATVGVENQSGQIAARHLVDGSPTVLRNLQALVFEPRFATGLAITPSTRLAFSGPVGGSFTPNSAVFTVANPGSATIRWRVNHSVPWLDVSPSSGTVAPAQNVEVLVEPSAAARDLPAGSYLDALEFVNTDTGLGNATREVSLTINSGTGTGFLAITPDTDFGAQGPPGGPFTPASKVYTLSNTGDAALDWAASIQHDWIELSRRTGTLGPGETTSITLAVAAPALELAPGDHLDTLTVTHLANPQPVSQRTVRLRVIDTSRPSLTLALTPAGGMSLQLTGQPGTIYLIESSDNLVDWSQLAIETMPANGLLPLPAILPTEIRRFYRAQSVP